MSLQASFTIPGSTANLGPGFDTLGLALSLFLTLRVTINNNAASSETLPPASSISINFTNIDVAAAQNANHNDIPSDWKSNLVTVVAAFVLFSAGKKLPCGTAENCITIDIENGIPLQRGLGSSSAAVVAGIRLANFLGELNLSTLQMLTYATCIEGEPDNVSASLLGGCIASMCDAAKVEEGALSFATFRAQLSQCSTYGEAFALCTSSIFSANVCRFVRVPWNANLKVVVLVPDFSLSTAASRKALPESYSKAQTIGSLQKLAFVVSLVGSSSLDSVRDDLHYAFGDELHQPYRMQLVPGLEELLKLPAGFIDGVVGITLSGAGPAIACFCTSNFDKVGEYACRVLSGHVKPSTCVPIKPVYRTLEVYNFQ